MFKVLATLVGALALSLAAVASGGGVKPLPPQAADAAANAPGQAIAAAAHRVTPATALAAAGAPGADTEIAPGLSAAQAVGLADGSRSAQSARRAAGGTLCFSVVMKGFWGAWPYATGVEDDTYWCGNGVTISYRTTHVLLTGGGLCGGHDAYGFKVGGGVGYYWEQERVGGYFDCPTYVPWITLHYDRHFDGIVTADGGAFTANQSG